MCAGVVNTSGCVKGADEPLEQTIFNRRLLVIFLYSMSCLWLARVCPSHRIVRMSCGVGASPLTEPSFCCKRFAWTTSVSRSTHTALHAWIKWRQIHWGFVSSWLLMLIWWHLSSEYKLQQAPQILSDGAVYSRGPSLATKPYVFLCARLSQDIVTT